MDNIEDLVDELSAMVLSSDIIYLQYKSEVDNSKRLGANYLAENMYLVTDPFQMSLIAFALHKSGHIRRSEAFGRLKSMRFPGGFIAQTCIQFRPRKLKVSLYLFSTFS